MKEKSLKTNFVWNSLGSFTYLFCQWLLTFFIIRLSNNLEDAGNLSLAMSITNVFFTVACFSMRPYLVSDNLNEYKVQDYSSFRFVTMIIAFVGCFIYCLLFDYSINQLLCIMIFMIYKIGEALVDLFHAFEQRKGRMDIGGISLFLRGIITIIFFILGMKIFNNMLVSLLLIAFFTIIFIFTYDFHNIKKFEVIKFTIKNKNNKSLFIKFLPLAIGAFLGTLSSSIPRQMLEKTYGADVLGIYATIAIPAVIVQVAVSYIYNPLLVTFSNYRKDKDYSNFRKLFSQTITIIFGISIVCCLGSLFFAKPVLSILYGNRIASHYKLFFSIIIYTSLTGFLWFFHNILVIFRKIKEISVINFTGFIICIMISSFFIKKFSMNGVNFTLILFTIIMIIEMLVIIIKCIKKLKKI